MRKDFVIPEVKGVSVAIINEEVEGEQGWYVYLINENKEELKRKKMFFLNGTKCVKNGMKILGF